ncbi:MAG: hypothetical protein ACOX8U_00060 [Bradymonadia bacterium]|jgi:hypothetical protein
MNQNFPSRDSTTRDAQLIMLDLSTISESFDSLHQLKKKHEHWVFQAYGGEWMQLRMAEGRIVEVHSDSELELHLGLATKKGNAWQSLTTTGNDPSFRALNIMRQELQDELKNASIGADPRTPYVFAETPTQAPPYYHKESARSTEASLLHRAFQWLKQVQAAGLTLDAQLQWENGLFAWDKKPLCFAYRDALRHFSEPRTCIDETLFIYDKKRPFFKRSWHHHANTRQWSVKQEFSDFLKSVSQQSAAPCYDFDANSTKGIYLAPYAVAQLVAYVIPILLNADKNSIQFSKELILYDDFSHLLHRAARYDENGEPLKRRNIVEAGQVQNEATKTIRHPALVAAMPTRVEAPSPDSFAQNELCCDFIQCLGNSVVCSHGFWNKGRIFAPALLPITALEILKRAKPLGPPQNIAGIVVSMLYFSLND